MYLSYVNERYDYLTDLEHYGFNELWTGLVETPTGRLVGDCEDYSITLKNKVSKFKKWDYWYCKLNDGGHCLLRDGDLVIDNNCRQVMSIIEYIKLYNIDEKSLRKYSKIEVCFKLLLGKLFLWYKKI